MPRRTTLRLAALTFLLAIAAAPAGAWPWDHDKIEGSGDLETRSFDLDGFDAIDLNGSLDVRVTFGSDTSVEVTIDDNLFDNLVLEVRGSTLVVDWDEQCKTHRKSRIDLVLPRLEEIELSGAGNVDIEDFRGDRFEFTLNGAGDLDMSGEVDELEISISGAGDVDTRELDARSAKVRISGAGDADVRASERFRGSISGVGDITYYGDPEDVDKSVSGIGRIRSK